MSKMRKRAEIEDAHAVLAVAANLEPISDDPAAREMYGFTHALAWVLGGNAPAARNIKRITRELKRRMAQAAQ